MQPVKQLTRDERQAVCVEKWKQSNGHSTIVGATGFGKTRVALKIIKWLQSIHPEITIIVVVPTTGLQEQWVEELDKFGCSREHIEVYVINSVIKRQHNCNLLILDECHRYASADFQKVFDVVTYNMILCLTATFERLDGKEKLIAKYAPVVDSVSIQECLANRWVSNYKEYVVVIEPDDIDVYNKLTSEFMSHFEFFDYDFGTGMSMVGKNGWKNRYNYAKEICQNQAQLKDTFKTVTIHAMGLMRAMQARKKYISSHPEKLRVAEEIIAHRPNSKIITFSATVAMAEQIQEGYVYTGKDSKKGNRVTLNEFSKMKSGVLNTVKKANEGINLPDLDVGIMLGVDSSKIKHAQTRGRVVRYQNGKNAEYFTLILKDTVEVEWWRRSQGKDACEIVDEENLMHVLNHEPYETYKEPLKQFVSNA